MKDNLELSNIDKLSKERVIKTHLAGRQRRDNHPLEGDQDIHLVGRQRKPGDMQMSKEGKNQRNPRTMKIESLFDKPYPWSDLIKSR